eukprot:m.82889 g.82889  ORF g.82889 m.82889 type:complete len:349 (+) comp9502_c0_seq1:51-1097(+)
MTAPVTMLMKVMAVRVAEVTYPTGNKAFSVLQCFPAGFSAEDADPFLMCDEFGPSPSRGLSGEDDFPVDWHPHRGQDLLTYMLRGVARHADSMGNRETVAAPGMQWMQAGSGIEHAEGGGAPKGVVGHGFQIWVNVPSALKMEEPAYGTVPHDAIPMHANTMGATIRVLSGDFVVEQADGDDTNTSLKGPFRTRVPALMLDVVMGPNGVFEHAIPASLDNVLVYAYGPSGFGQVGGRNTGSDLLHGHIARLDATNDAARMLRVDAGSEGMSILVFAGRKLNQPIAWHGPFVMTTDEEIRQTMQEYRLGTFLKKRAPWDFKRLSAAPPEVQAKAKAAAAAVLTSVRDEL